MAWTIGLEMHESEVMDTARVPILPPNVQEMVDAIEWYISLYQDVKKTAPEYFERHPDPNAAQYLYEQAQGIREEAIRTDWNSDFVALEATIHELCDTLNIPSELDGNPLSLTQPMGRLFFLEQIFKALAEPVVLPALEVKGGQL